MQPSNTSAQSPPCSRKRLPSCASAICFCSARISHDVTSGGSTCISCSTPSSAAGSGYVGNCNAERLRQLAGDQSVGRLTARRLRSEADMDVECRCVGDAATQRISIIRLNFRRCNGCSSNRSFALQCPSLDDEGGSFSDVGTPRSPPRASAQSAKPGSTPASTGRGRSSRPSRIRPNRSLPSGSAGRCPWTDA